MEEHFIKRVLLVKQMPLDIELIRKTPHIHTVKT